MAVSYTMGPKVPALAPQWGQLAVPTAPPNPAQAAAASAVRNTPWQTGASNSPVAGPNLAASGHGHATMPPPDPAYTQTVAALERQRAAALAALTQQRGQALLQYGYVEDPVTGAVSFDTTNTYGQAALLQRNYNQARSGNVNQFAARGGLYSGALQTEQDTSYFNQGRAQNSLQSELAAFLARNTQGATSAGVNFDMGMADARAGQLGRIADNPLYDPVVASDPVSAAAQQATVASSAQLSAPAASTPARAAAAAADKRRPGATHKAKIRKVAQSRPMKPQRPRATTTMSRKRRS